MLSLRQKSVQLFLILCILYATYYLIKTNVDIIPKAAVCRDEVKRLYVEEEETDYKVTIGGKKTKYALLWTPYHGDPYWGLKRETVDHHYFSKLECAETNCIVTSDRRLRPIDQFNSIVFSGSESWNEIPAKRHENQLYMFATLDPPTKMMRNLSHDADFFNLTSELYFYEKLLYQIEQTFLDSDLQNGLRSVFWWGTIPTCY
jgi:hypothetical protein